MENDYLRITAWLNTKESLTWLEKEKARIEASGEICEIKTRGNNMALFYTEESKSAGFMENMKKVSSVHCGQRSYR